MRVLFISPNSFPPQTYGGIETATLDLCASLRDEGHAAAVMSGLAHGDALWLANRVKSVLFRRRFPRDCFARTPVFRGWHLGRNLGEVVRHWRPDAAVVQARNALSHEVAAAALQLGLPTGYYAHDVSVFRDDFELDKIRGARWLANSDFTAAAIRAALGVEARTIPVLVRAQAYRTESTGEYVAMINPRHMKGGHIALAVAALCPDIPFLFVEAWEGDHAEIRALKEKYAGLGNVTWLRSRRDMRSIYGRARIMFVPSQCEETWGRVVTEAHFSGIPALASRLGALPETVGDGGLLVDADAAPEQWAAALRTLWNDAAVYRRCADAARRHAARVELSPAHIVGQLVDALR